MLLMSEIVEKIAYSALVAGFLTGLTSCMSVPAMTIAKLAPLSPLEANPAEIRVAILGPEDLVLKKGDAVLTVSWLPEGGRKTELNYDLDVLVGNAAAPQLISRMKPGQKMSVLRLDENSVGSLRGLQADVVAAKAQNIHGKGSFSVGFKGACWNGTFPTDHRPMPFEPFIQTEVASEFLPLFQGVDVMDLLKQAKTTTLPSCPVVLKKGPRIS